MPQTAHSEISSCKSISDAFLYAHSKDGFETLPPSSLLHESVPMSFVMSAGLIQVENELDKIVKKTGGKFAFTQPCFRHFDVRQVGIDTTHLSLFHMSAAFYIGCSQRETVLPRLWNFLIEVLKLEKAHLWVTYLDDDEFGRDQRTFDCWRNVGVDKSRLIGLNQKHCFWRQRSTGQIASDGKKCGPHTEVFFERVNVSCTKDCDQGNPGSCRCGRFVEISNSLFIENYISDNNKLIPADTVFAECVIGIERLAMIIQRVADVHHVDRFNGLRESLNPHIPKRVVASIEGSINIILDHLSALDILVGDGAPEPGRGGRRTIIRKLARGAMTEMLLHGIHPKELFLSLQDRIQEKSLKYLEAEYQLYERTLEKGYRRLRRNSNSYSEQMLKKLNDNHGLPIPLAKKYYRKNIIKGVPLQIPRQKTGVNLK
jgi:alanyl-tRNA synthetase